MVEELGLALSSVVGICGEVEGEDIQFLAWGSDAVTDCWFIADADQLWLGCLDVILALFSGLEVNEYAFGLVLLNEDEAFGCFCCFLLKRWILFWNIASY